MQRHKTVLVEDERPEPFMCSETDCELQHCPLCPYKSPAYKMYYHIDNHMNASVRYEEFTIIQCSDRQCRTRGHYHCCYCSATVINKGQVLKHIYLHQDEFQPEKKSMAQHSRGRAGRPPDKVSELISKCLQARDMAYCPYSRFPVGAAVLAADGNIITGCNVENASFGLTVCAERTAVHRAVAKGHRRFTAIAVTCDIKDHFVGPCGACRQVLMEFGADWIVYLTKPDGSYKETSLRELLPLAFSPAHLNKDR